MENDWQTIATPKEIKEILEKEDKIPYKWVTRCGRMIFVHNLTLSPRSPYPQLD